MSVPWTLLRVEERHVLCYYISSPTDPGTGCFTWRLWGVGHGRARERTVAPGWCSTLVPGWQERDGGCLLHSQPELPASPRKLASGKPPDSLRDLWDSGPAGEGQTGETDDFSVVSDSIYTALVKYHSKEKHERKHCPKKHLFCTNQGAEPPEGLSINNLWELTGAWVFKATGWIGGIGVQMSIKCTMNMSGQLFVQQE